MTSSLETIIKSRTPVVQESTPPVIVVGLPRSGSSYMAHVLSCMQDWFVFDDLYPYQKATELGISNNTDLSAQPELLKQYVNKLTWQLRAKIKWERNFEIPNLSWDDTFEMEEALIEALTERKPLYWYHVLEEWIQRLTLHYGKKRWGYKTPQDFMHMDDLTDIFPGVKFVYIVRDPRKVLSSLKNLPKVKTDGTQDGESRQYHPYVYALYWKKAFDSVERYRQKNKAPVETIQFEELVKKPVEVAERLAAFLETTVEGNVVVEKGNSSLQQGTPRPFTATEIKICESVAGAQMQKLDYALQQPSARLGDLFDLLSTTWTFTLFQLQRMVVNKRARNSVKALLKNLIPQKS